MKRFFNPVKTLTIKEIKNILNCEISDNCDLSKQFVSFAPLDKAQDNELSFLSNSKYKEQLLTTKAGACLLSPKDVKNAPSNLMLLIVNDPYKAFALLSQQFYPNPIFKPFVSPHCVIDSTAQVDETAHISHFAVVGKNVSIGKNVYIGSNTIIYDDVVIEDDTTIYGNCSIKYAIIGKNCIIHDGVRIGQDGFGFAAGTGGHVKIPQIGGVIIGEHVEIGSNTTIDRGAINNTIIKKGTKIDNLVQIAHNDIIGEHCFLAGQSGIAGSTVLEDYVSIGGNSAIAPHLKIGTGAQVVGHSGVTRDLNPKEVVMGTPAIPFTTFWRLQAILKKMLQKAD
jgi:UDP-3-O-[3-hydroxymyristoyl] glucosamine N-acyltransferase